jgi:hypothetical protein
MRKQANSSNHLSHNRLAVKGSMISSHGLSKMKLSMHENTVYEGDSIKSSQY